MSQEQFKKTNTGIKISKTQRFNGVVVHEYELILLKHLYLHRQLRATSVHEMILFLSKKKIASSNISNRLKKLTDSGVLERMNEEIFDLRGNFVRYYYKLGQNGLNVLAFIGYVDLERMKNYAQSQYLQRLPSFHNKAASVITNAISIECMKQETPFEFCRGVNHELLGNDAFTRMSSNSGLIIPDYVFENAHTNTIVCLEIDTGKQRTQVINKKIEKYVLHANSEFFSTKTVIVVFVVVDNSVSDSYGTERARRVYSLKANFESALNIPGNMELYAVNSKQALTLIPSLLAQSLQLESIEQDFICEDFMELYSEKHNLYFEKMELSKTASSLFNAAYESRIGTVKKKIYLMYRVEGALLDYQKSASALSYLENRLSNNEDVTLMYIYESAESALADVTVVNNTIINVAASYVPKDDTDELVFYSHTASFKKKIVKE